MCVNWHGTHSYRVSSFGCNLPVAIQTESTQNAEPLSHYSGDRHFPQLLIRFSTHSERAQNVKMMGGHRCYLLIFTVIWLSQGSRLLVFISTNKGFVSHYLFIVVANSKPLFFSCDALQTQGCSWSRCGADRPSVSCNGPVPQIGLETLQIVTLLMKTCNSAYSRTTNEHFNGYSNLKQHALPSLEVIKKVITPYL